MSELQTFGTSGEQDTRQSPGPRHLMLVGLLVAQAFSLTGTRLSAIALPWFVITTTGSAVLTGVAAFAQMGPYVVAKAASGPLLDRFGPRRVVIVAEVGAGLAVLAVPVLHLLDALSFPLFCVLVALVGVMSGPADGGKNAMVPSVAAGARVPLERVTGLSGTIERLATTVGTGLAGALVAWLGAAPSLFVTVGTFTVAAAVIALSGPRQAPGEAEPYLASLLVGARVIGRDKLLVSIFAMNAVTNLLDAALFSVVLPVWAARTGAGPTAVGLLAATMSAGAVLASMLAAGIGHRMPRRATYIVGFLVAGAPRFVVLALDVPLSVSLAVFAAAGLGAGFLNPIIGAVIFERIPDGLVGRVSVLGSSLAWAGIPFGGIIGGALVAGLALSPTLLLLGGAYLVTTTLPALLPAWRELDRRE